MTISLVKGQKADLTKTNPTLGRIIVGMGWRSPENVEIDFSAFMLNEQSKVTRDEDLIFYGNPVGGNASVSIQTGEKLMLSGIQDQEQVTIVLQNIPQQYHRVALSLTIYEGDRRKQNFALTDGMFIRIMDASTGNVLIRYDLGKAFSVETAIVVGELYRYNGDWKFSAVGSGYSGGLEALCESFGIEVKAEPSSATPTPKPIPEPVPVPIPSPVPVPPIPTPMNQHSTPPPAPLAKIELKKRGDVINLQKGSGPIGEIRVNLNWNQKKAGFFGGRGVDLDLGCLFEMKDGSKGTVQALGESFGSFFYLPYIELDGDDRTGMTQTGENLRINGAQVQDIKRILIYAFIYEGVSKWSEADGVVTIRQQEGPDIVIRMDEHKNGKGMCAIAMITNVNDQTFSIEKLVQYFSGHRDMDEAYRWGLRWVKGSK
ncbi:tellurium resistance protein TerA [Paenibacillus sp. HJL G12]|uniref:Tellurium resistance protein TerA n=1 Tax=Paenibacillus dendrobii TaxID=2691084 RepID=A0A7X3ILJ6_9BACL|nr:TerD family protein [Paenibacillus dendrobii]MWV45733.1 tellurium resistance protein TerA [Paenibacillus dendrobii]